MTGLNIETECAGDCFKSISMGQAGVNRGRAHERYHAGKKFKLRPEIDSCLLGCCESLVGVRVHTEFLPRL